MGEARFVRHTARVVLLDSDNRVMLLHYSGRAEGAAWITPGGGVERGETHEQAAVREVWEEVGLRNAVVERWVWQGSHHSFNPWGLPQLTRGRYYLVRTQPFEPGGHIDLDEYEREVVTARRWWTLPEIEASEELFLPTNMAELLRDVIAGTLSEEPVEVDW